MKTIKFNNLVEARTGKTLEIEVPDDFDENNPVYVAAGERGKAFAKRIQAVQNHLREVESLDEVGRLGSESGKKLFELFNQHGF